VIIDFLRKMCYNVTRKRAFQKAKNALPFAGEKERKMTEKRDASPSVLQQPSALAGKTQYAPDSDEYYMALALDLAREAAEEGEVPVGAVALWSDGRVVGLGRNRREKEKCALCHAEIEAIGGANSTLGGWRLHKCTLFVTLEPCPMCAGAILNSRIARLVYGAADPKAGAYGSVFNINDLPLNHKPEVTSGVLEEECAALLRDFFKDLRKKKGEAP
jgi:tRNA(adenine34) deaminase